MQVRHQKIPFRRINFHSAEYHHTFAVCKQAMHDHSLKNLMQRAVKFTALLLYMLEKGGTFANN